MSGGIAYVYDADGLFRQRCNLAMVDVEPIDPAADTDVEEGRPQQRASNVHDYGMGDMLRHDAARLRILLERHHLHTGSTQAAALLDDWDNMLSRFVKVMPRDYRRALQQLEAERLAAANVAAE
jgi:glutamate synthase (NADPH/NADH) large chain